MIRLALYLAFRRGFSGVEIRAAVERWLAAAPPDHVVVVDPSAEMGELLVHEVKEGLGVGARSCAIAELEKNPALLAGALALTLPYHLETVARLAPAAAVEPVTLEVSKEDREAILSMPDGAIVLVVSHSPTVLPFAEVVLKSLRGDEILVETRPLSATREWKRLVPAADLVFADALSVAALRRAGARKLHEVRFVSKQALERLRDALTVVIPRRAETPASVRRKR
jgi:hypothetical protein